MRRLSQSSKHVLFAVALLLCPSGAMGGPPDAPKPANQPDSARTQDAKQSGASGFEVHPSVSSASSRDLQALFVQGNELFRSGLEAAKTDRSLAESRFREAAAAWRTVATIGQVQNVRLETNIANASLLAGDVPRAIAAYRRALAIDPLDADVKSGLMAARRAAGTEAISTGAPVADSSGVGKVADGGVAGALKRIGSLAGSAADRFATVFPPKILLMASYAFYVGAFVLGIARVLRWNKLPIWLPGLFFCVGLMAAIPLIAKETISRNARDAVVIQANLIARNGPAELYEPAFNEPLRPGLEAQVVEARGTWGKIRLRDGRAAWVPLSGLEIF